MFGLFETYPPPAFYFMVYITGLPDTSFQEVSGIGPEIVTEDVKEGGENRFSHSLPNGMKHPNLVLKRGIAFRLSPLALWCESVLEGGLGKTITTRDVDVVLMNKGLPFLTWSFVDAYPVKWQIDAFNSTKNQVAIETIELSYSYSERIT